MAMKLLETDCDMVKGSQDPCHVEGFSRVEASTHIALCVLEKEVADRDLLALEPYFPPVREG